MPISNRFILKQRATLGALGRTAMARVLQRRQHQPIVPGPLFETEFSPRDAALVDAYLEWIGADPRHYRATLPFHFFPQWGLGLATQAIARLNYPLLKAVNGGCRLEIHDDLPNDEPLVVSAQLIDIDDDGYRAVLTTRIITGTHSAPRALVADFRTFVPLARRPEQARKKTSKRVPDDALSLETWCFDSRAGLDFARLTGDFNPMHWIPGYARRVGFKNTILHGFASMARASERLERLLRKEGRRLESIDVRFTRPLVLPSEVQLLVDDDAVFVGDEPGGDAYMMGSFSPTTDTTP